MLPSPSLLDTPTALLGDSIWREALGPQIRLLDALAQAGGSLQVLNRLQGQESRTPELRIVELSAAVTDLIGMDVARSTVVTSTSDGLNPLRSSMQPRRARHTLDEYTVWIDTDGYSVTSFNQYLLLPDTPRFVAEDTAAWQTWWVCACPEDLGEVVAVYTKDSVLLAGLDFYRSLDRLLFRQHPAVLFEDGVLRVAARAPRMDNVAYTARVEGSMDVVQAAAVIMRQGPTVKRLQTLVDAMTGVIELREPGVVQQCIPLGAGARYVFEHQDLLVPFDHALLEPGTMLPAGYKFGEVIRLAEQGGQGPNWWRALNLSDGLLLDDVCPVKGITMPADPVRAVGYLDGDTVRVKLDVRGSPEQVERYQAFCRDVERRKESQLADLLGITTAGQTKYVDGLDLLFRHVFGRRVILVLARTDAPAHVLKTLRDMTPLSTCLLVHRLPPDAPWLAAVG